MRSNKYYHYATILVLFAIIGCTKPEGPSNGQEGNPFDFGEYGKIEAASYVATGSYTDLTAYSVKLLCSMNSELIGSSMPKCTFGVIYSSDKSELKISGKSAQTMGVTGNKYEVSISDLRPETEYFYCAYLSMSEGSNFFAPEIKSFTTKSIDLTTGDVSDLKALSCNVNIGINKDQLKPVKEFGVLVAPYASLTIEDTYKKIAINKDQASSLNTVKIDELNYGVEYFYKAYAIVSCEGKEEYFYGEEKSFTTTDISVQTLGVDLIDRNRADFRVGTNSDMSATEVGVCISTAPNPTIFNYDFRVIAENGSAAVDELSAGVTYYYRAYGIYTSGDNQVCVYGETKQFDTDPVIIELGGTTDCRSDSAILWLTFDGSQVDYVSQIGFIVSTDMDNLGSKSYLNDSFAAENVYIDVYSASVTRLSKKTKYYYRAYVYAKSGRDYHYYYSDNIYSFITENISLYGSVDMGLSVKWGAYNVGASAPEESGSYYAWGEIKTKSEYTIGNCTSYGNSLLVDSNGNLYAVYDAANMNLGARWRMPTKEQFQELIDKCTWTSRTYCGVNGYEITGPSGNSIFLPAAGLIDGTDIEYNDTTWYWTATKGSDTSGIGAISVLGTNMCSLNRCYGLTIRPVYKN